MEIYNIIILLFGFIIFLLLILLYFINRILQHKLKINNAFSSVKILLNTQLNIVDSMIDFLKDNFPDEKNLRKTLNAVKDNITTIKNNKDGIKTIKKIEKELLKFNSLESAYPKLNKNKKYNSIRTRIENNQNELIYALDTYDVEVIKYNNYSKHKLIKILSKLCFVPEYGCYNKLK